MHIFGSFSVANVGGVLDLPLSWLEQIWHLNRVISI